MLAYTTRAAKHKKRENITCLRVNNSIEQVGRKEPTRDNESLCCCTVLPGVLKFAENGSSNFQYSFGNASSAGFIINNLEQPLDGLVVEVISSNGILGAPRIRLSPRPCGLVFGLLQQELAILE